MKLPVRFDEETGSIYDSDDNRICHVLYSFRGMDEQKQDMRDIVAALNQELLPLCRKLAEALCNCGMHNPPCPRSLHTLGDKKQGCTCTCGLDSAKATARKAGIIPEEKEAEHG